MEAFLSECSRLYDTGRPGGVRLPTTAQAGWLIAAGFAPADIPAWFPTNDFYSPKRVRDMNAFRRNGWTANDLSALKATLTEQENTRGSYVPDSERNKWATLPPGTARTASAAGLTPADAHRLLRTGVYDEPALRLVTALQDDPIPVAI